MLRIELAKTLSVHVKADLSLIGVLREHSAGQAIGTEQ